MFHENNRQRLYAHSQGALIVVTAYDALQQSGDMAAPFLQESSFWWLTGITEPGWKLVLDTARKHATLVRPERSEVDILFNGESNDELVRNQSGIADIIPAKEFERFLRQAHRHHAIAKTLTSKQAHEFVLNPALAALEATLKRIFDSVQHCDQLLAELRAIKQPEELARMRKAAKLTCAAFAEVRQQLSTLKTEAEVEAEYIYRFHRQGATHAYEPIVASGHNACVLHYTANNAKLRAKELVLIDIGARVDGYSADVTRTYCLNPTKRQRAVHCEVERAEQRIIALIKPGLSVREYIQQGDEIMKDALETLGLLPDRTDEAAYRTYFPHSVSHGLGVDTHDSLGAPRYFEPGMVLTVEPGIYIDAEGIGVRIEDDILVTDSGHENLTASLPTAI